MSANSINPDIYRARRAELVGRAGGPVLVFGHGSALGAGTKSHGSMRYLTGWDSHEAFSLLICHGDSAHLLISSPFLVPLARTSLPDVEIIDLRPPDWPSALTRFLPSQKPAIVGFDEMPAGLFAALGLDECRTATQALDEMRLTKTAEESAVHKKGAAICNHLFQALPEQFSATRAVWEIQLSLETLARQLGADYCRTWLTAGPVADYPRFWPEEGQRVPQTGDQILFGIALTVEGHWAHGIRMGSYGPAQARHHALWQQVCAMLEAGLDAIRPGQPLAECEAAMTRILAQYFPAPDIARMIRFRNGHGLGQSYEDPLITDCFPQHFGVGISAPNSTTPPDLLVQEGMLLELHPNFFLPDIGGAAIGQMVLVEAGANTSLITQPIDFFEISPRV